VETAVPEFWLTVLVVAPCLGWIVGYFRAALVRRVALTVFSALPFIVFGIAMLSARPGNHDGPWILIGLAMTGIVELPWVSLLLAGFGLHRLKHGAPLG
jgi:hypothetical protein